MTAGSPPPPSPGRTQDRQRLMVVREDSYELITDCLGPAGEAGQAPLPKGATPNGGIDRPSDEGGLEGWDDPGPEAA